MSSAGRDQILRAAIASFSERGFDGTTTAGVARAAGVTQPLVHHHFGSKEGLYEAVLDALFAPLLERLALASELSAQAPSPDWLRQLLIALTCAMAEDPALARLLVLEGGRRGPASDALWRRWGAPIEALIGPITARLVRQGLAPALPRWMLVSLVLGACSRPFLEVESIRQREGEDPLQPEQVARYAELVAEVLTTGLATAAAGSEEAQGGGRADLA